MRIAFWAIVSIFVALAGSLPANATDLRAEEGALLCKKGAAISCVEASGAGTFFASGDREGTLRLFDARGGQELWSAPKAHAGPIMALLFDREELTLFSLGAGGLVKSWALPGQKKPLAVSAPIAGAAGLCWSPDRREIWTVPSGGGVQPIQKQSLALGRLILKGVGPMGLIRTMDDGHFAGAAPAGLLLEASPDYGVLHSVSLDADALDVAGIKQDGEIRYLAALTAAGEARFLDAKDLALKKAVPLQGSGEGLRWAFLSDEVRRAVLINQDGGLTAYRLPSGLADGQASAPGPLSAAALDAEGHWLLLGGVDGSLRLWRHPGWQAQFIRVLDAAQAAEQAGHWEMAMQQYSQALAIYPEPSVRADLERVKQARLDQARENTRRMRELSGGH